MTKIRTQSGLRNLVARQRRIIAGEAPPKLFDYDKIVETSYLEADLGIALVGFATPKVNCIDDLPDEYASVKRFYASMPRRRK